MDNSPLDRLPAEIRNEIYSLVLTQPGGMNLFFTKPRVVRGKQTHGKWDTLRKNIGAEPLAITKACRQMRLESLPVLFKTNSFNINTATLCFGVYGRSLNHAMQLLRQMPPHLLKAMKPVTVVCEGEDTGATPVSQFAERTCLFLGDIIAKMKPVQTLFGKENLRFSVSISYHRWGGGGRTHMIFGRAACLEEPHMSSTSCGAIEFVLRGGDEAELALKEAEKAYNEKVGLLKAHSHHSMCVIRLESAKLLAGLDEAYAEMWKAIKAKWPIF